MACSVEGLRPFYQALIGRMDDIIGYLPRPDQAKMWAYQAFAHGCESMLWFNWRSMTRGAEQYCFGIIDHDNRTGRKYDEVRRTIAERLKLNLVGTRQEIARLLAQDIPDGAYVNLGIGLPTLVARHLPRDREIFLHSENGLLAMGPAPSDDTVDPDLVDAGKQPVTLLPGGAFFHHADSFAMMRGGHIDICVMGAYQVSATGDLANWHAGAPDAIPAVGGAMDLAAGAKQVFVMMDHLTKTGESKIVERCSYPLTGIGCVSRIYTDLAVIDITPKGFALVELAPGVAFDFVQERTGAPSSTRPSVNAAAARAEALGGFGLTRWVRLSSAMARQPSTVFAFCSA